MSCVCKSCDLFLATSINDSTNFMKLSDGCENFSKLQKDAYCKIHYYTSKKHDYVSQCKFVFSYSSVVLYATDK